MTNVFYARLVLNVPRIFLSIISRIFLSFFALGPRQNIVLCDKLLAITAIAAGIGSLYLTLAKCSKNDAAVKWCSK
jgi:hypothetical protein